MGVVLVLGLDHDCIDDDRRLDVTRGHVEKTAGDDRGITLPAPDVADPLAESEVSAGARAPDGHGGSVQSEDFRDDGRDVGIDGLDPAQGIHGFLVLEESL